MMIVEPLQARRARVGKLLLEVYPTAKLMGQGAAMATATEMIRLGQTNETIPAIFATGASQLATLDALTCIPGIPWEKVVGFHLDEYVGLPIEHGASFRGYLRRNLTEKVKMKTFYEIDGTASDLTAAIDNYAHLLAEAKPQFCMLGIGENGHLAFNDPDVADFHDPLAVKAVALDEACRSQQVAEGWFSGAVEVPPQAVTLTIPTILKVPRLIVSVPGKRKAAILRRALEEEISPACPATILREHPGTTIFVDEEAAWELGDLKWS